MPKPLPVHAFAATRFITCRHHSMTCHAYTACTTALQVQLPAINTLSPVQMSSVAQVQGAYACRRSVRARRAPDKLSTLYLSQVSDKIAKKSTKGAGNCRQGKGAAAGPAAGGDDAAAVASVPPITRCTGAAARLELEVARRQRRKELLLAVGQHCLTEVKTAEAARRAQAALEAAALGFTPRAYVAALLCVNAEDIRRRAAEPVTECEAELAADQAALAKSKSVLATAQQTVADLNEALPLACPKDRYLMRVRLHEAERTAADAALRVFEAETFVDVSAVHLQEAQRELSHAQSHIGHKMRSVRRHVRRRAVALGMLRESWAK